MGANIKISGQSCPIINGYVSWKVKGSPIVYSQLIRDLSRLGLEAGDMVMVHSSMRAVGKVLGGPDVVIRALLDVVETVGTIVMYVDWEDAVQHLTRDDVAGRKADVRWLEELPPFDRKTSRARRAYRGFSQSFFGRGRGRAGVAIRMRPSPQLVHKPSGSARTIRCSMGTALARLWQS